MQDLNVFFFSRNEIKVFEENMPGFGQRVEAQIAVSTKELTTKEGSYLAKQSVILKICIYFSTTNVHLAQTL